MVAPLDRVKALLATLPREEQEEIAAFLDDILVPPDLAEDRHVASLEVRKAGKPVTYTYRNEWVRCGRAGCRCEAGDKHGPYTYRYWREGKKVKKSYVGRAPRTAAAPKRR